jgi:hypothetical protein
MCPDIRYDRLKNFNRDLNRLKVFAMNLDGGSAPYIRVKPFGSKSTNGSQSDTVKVRVK